jgi:hypothetical protein
MPSPYSTGRRGVQYGTGHISGSRSQSDAGARAFYELSKRLKEVGGTGKGSLRNEMQKALKRAAKPLPQAVKAAAREQLPKGGGLNDRVAKRTPTVSTRTGATTAGVRIQDKKTDPRMSDQGRIPHPVFGRRGKAKNGGRNFVIQVAPKVQGYFDETLREKAPDVRQAVVDVLADYAKQIARC